MGFNDMKSELERMLSGLEEVKDTTLVKGSNSYKKESNSATENVDKLLGDLSGVLDKNTKATYSEQKNPKKKPLNQDYISNASNEKLEKLFSTENKKTMNGKAHVLVVDDDVRVLKMVQEILKADYNVSVAPSGKTALNFLTKHKTDLILLDYLMPGMTGKEVLEEIRTNPLFADTPVFFLTGVADKDKVTECLKLRPKGYMLKPVKRNELLAKLKTILS